MANKILKTIFYGLVLFVLSVLISIFLVLGYCRVLPQGCEGGGEVILLFFLPLLVLIIFMLSTMWLLYRKRNNTEFVNYNIAWKISHLILGLLWGFGFSYFIYYWSPIFNIIIAAVIPLIVFYLFYHKNRYFAWGILIGDLLILLWSFIPIF